MPKRITYTFTLTQDELDRLISLVDSDPDLFEKFYDAEPDED